MEIALDNNFSALSENELNSLNGGFIIAVVAIGTATYTITSGMAVGAIATAYGIGGTAYQIYKAFK